MVKPSNNQSSTRRRIFGLFLLFIVNILWVAAAEITRFIFVDLNFKRPFFTTYVKLCMLTLYLLRYFMIKRDNSGPNEQNGYNKLVSDGTETFDMETLTPAEFEPVGISEDSETEHVLNIPRRVRFAQVREVRHMPPSLAHDAFLARLPYSATSLLCRCDVSRDLKYTAVLSPLWILCTLTYQASLLFSPVSSVNLISASSSLFVLLLSAVCAFSPADRLTLTKLLLVVCNFIGVAVVSEYSLSAYGTSLALISSFCYAVYLVFFTYCQNSGYEVDMNLMFGMVGLLTVLIYSPLLLSLHCLSVESLLPLPDRTQFSMLVLNGVVGTVFSDYIWLQATILTSSLAASISLSLCIPMSLLADTFFRAQPPSLMQLVAAVPITLSFLGVAFLRSNMDLKSDQGTKSGIEEGVSLIDDGACDEEEQL